MPNDALRRGDFSSAGATIYDPASNPDPALRTPFPGNIIPANRIDPAALEMINRLPLPNNGTSFVNNYQAQGTEDYERDNNDFKVTYQPGSNFTLFGRYSYSPSDIFDPPALGDAGGDALAGGQLGSAPGRTHIAGFGGTYLFSPRVLLDANFGYTHQKLGAEGPDLGTNFGLDVLHIPGTNGPDRMQSGMPSFQVNGWANLGNPNTGNPFQFNDKQYVWNANLSWFRGAHTMRTGFDYSNQQINHFQPQGGTFQTARGTFQFNGNSTLLQNSPAPTDTRFNSWADFLLGLPSGAGKVEQLRNPNSVHMRVYAVYAQDQWRATNNLTLTYGLRWEYYAWPTRGGDLGVSRFDPDDGNVYTGGLTGVPIDTNVDVGPGEFLPRVGAAYQLNDRMVRARRVRTELGSEAVHRLPQRLSDQLRMVASAGDLQRGHQSLHPGHDAAARPERGGLRAAPGSDAGRPAAADRRRHDDFSGNRHARAHPLVERRAPAGTFHRRHRPGGLRRDAGEGPAGLRQHQCQPARHRQRRPSAGGLRHCLGHQSHPAVRRYVLPRAANGRESADGCHHLWGRLHAVANHELCGQRRQPPHSALRLQGAQLRSGRLRSHAQSAGLLGVGYSVPR